MTALFADDPAALARTLEIAARCTFSLAELRYRYPAERLPDGTTESRVPARAHLRGRARALSATACPTTVRAQLENELALIEELDYGGYFLTMYEIVQFCRRSDDPVPGPRLARRTRAVCFCLGITAVDPVRMDLLFERFLSRERAEPPDIDLDIEHERREEVIQHVYERYGRRHAAMVAQRHPLPAALGGARRRQGARHRRRPRSIALRKLLGGATRDVEREALAHAGLDPRAPAHAHLAAAVPTRSRSSRATCRSTPAASCSATSRSTRLVPIETATMEGRTVIQWDKDDVEDLGLFKVDLLGLGALTPAPPLLRSAARARAASTSTMATIPPRTPTTYDMICARRHGRRVPDREPRADVDAAAPASRGRSTTW